MNKEEKTAEEYLKREYSCPPVHEPDGQTTPDFCCNERVAYEVRRLNRTFLLHGKPIGEENIYIGFQQALKRRIRIFDSQYGGITYWIAIHYVRPFLVNDKQIWKCINDNLSSFLNSNRAQLPYEFSLGDGEISFSISEAPTSVPGSTFKIVGSGLIDDYSLITLYTENIKFCIAEKTRKVEPHKHKYPEWHLLLVNSVGWDLGPVETEKVMAAITNLGNFDSVIVIDYLSNFLFKI